MNVVFDIGNVLIHWDPRALYRKMFSSEDEVEWFLGHVCTADWNLEQDRGRSFEDAIAEATSRHPGHAEAIAAYEMSPEVNAFSSKYDLFLKKLVTLSPGAGEAFSLGSQVTDTGGNVNSLLKTGGGTATLVAANDYTGGTTVAGGKLLVNNPTGLAIHRSYFASGKITRTEGVKFLYAKTG